MPNHLKMSTHTPKYTPLKKESWKLNCIPIHSKQENSGKQNLKYFKKLQQKIYRICSRIQCFLTALPAKRTSHKTTASLNSKLVGQLGNDQFHLPDCCFLLISFHSSSKQVIQLKQEIQIRNNSKSRLNPKDYYPMRHFLQVVVFGNIIRSQPKSLSRLLLTHQSHLYY